jgi:hypothetical protein
MTQPDPDSSPEYNPYELFTEELDLDAFDLEQTPPPRTIAAHQESTSTAASTEPPFATQDEDRLYTDELIRQNEMASRSLFLSVIAAAVISVGIGLWYLSQKPTPTPQPVAPLPVPEQPAFAPPIVPSPITPSIPTNPSNQISPLAPTDSGVVPGGLPTSKPTFPTQTSPSGETVPPPPPLPGKSNP